MKNINLKVERIKKSMTQADLAKKAKVGISTVRALERGDVVNPKLQTMNAISRALEVPVESIFKIENPVS